MKACGRIIKVEGDRLTVFPDGARCAGCAGGHCSARGRTVQVRNLEAVPVRVSDRVEIAASLRRGFLDFSFLVLLPLGLAAVAAGPAASWLGIVAPAGRAALALPVALIAAAANLLRRPPQDGGDLPTLYRVVEPAPGRAGRPAMSSSEPSSS